MGKLNFPPLQKQMLARAPGGGVDAAVPSAVQWENKDTILVRSSSSSSSSSSPCSRVSAVANSTGYVVTWSQARKHSKPERSLVI